MSKRKRPGSEVPSERPSEHEKMLYDIIKSKKDMGIWLADLKRESKLPPNVVDKSVKSMVGKELIKRVVHVRFKGRPYYMASEFEPSADVTGGEWFTDGALDTGFINTLRSRCVHHISNQKVATVDVICDAIERSKVFNTKLSSKQIAEMLKTLVLDDEILEVRSTGRGEFAFIPKDRICYKLSKKSRPGKEPKEAVLASNPCGVCPRIKSCSPDGIISPITCGFFDKFLEF